MDWTTVREVSERLDVPERTLRRWIELHGPFIGAKKEGRRILIPMESVDALREIRDLYADGMTAQEVTERLRSDGLPMTIDMADGGPPVAVNVAEALQELSKAVAVPMAEIAERQNEIMEAVVFLTDELQEERERSQALSDELAAIRRELAATKEPGRRSKDQAAILKEVRATREKLEARQRKQEKRLEEIAEYVRPKPEKKRRWPWPWSRHD